MLVQVTLLHIVSFLQKAKPWRNGLIKTFHVFLFFHNATIVDVAL